MNEENPARLARFAPTEANETLAPMFHDWATLALTRADSVLRACSIATQVAGVAMIEGADFMGARYRKHADHYRGLAGVRSPDEALALHTTFLHETAAHYADGMSQLLRRTLDAARRAGDVGAFAATARED